MNALLTFDSRKWLNKIKAPCLIINGDDDLIVQVEQAEEMVSTIPDAEYICFHNVGHVTFIEQKEEFIKRTTAFISKFNRC